MIRLTPLIQAIVVVLCLMGAGCDQVKQLLDIKDPQQIAKGRKKAVMTAATLSIGVVWPSEDNTMFIDGVNLAVDEINAAGGLLNKKVSIDLYDQSKESFTDKERATFGRRTARALARKRDTFAVIGHPDSSAAIPSSIVYEEYGVLFIAPGATTPLLTRHGFNNVFRTIQDDKELASRLARFADQKGWHRVAILNERTMYGEGLTRAFIEEVGDPNIDVSVVYRRSFSSHIHEYSQIIADLKREALDVVLLVTTEEHGAGILKQARVMDLDVEFIAGDGLYGPLFLKNGGEAVNGVYLATSIDPGAWGKSSTEFADKFIARFGHMPNGWAAQGYDAIKLLAQAIRQTSSFDRVVVASALRYEPRWSGVASDFSFDQSGNVVNRDIFIKQIVDGKVVDVGTYTWNAKQEEILFVPISQERSQRAG